MFSQVDRRDRLSSCALIICVNVPRHVFFRNPGLSELRRLILFDLQAAVRGGFGTRRPLCHTTVPAS